MRPSTRRLLVLPILAVALPLSSQQIETDPAPLALDDPELWRIVESGPADSAELERAVTAYAASAMPDEVIALFARYLLQTDSAADLCDYCVSLLPIEHNYEDSGLTRLFFEAADEVVGRAYEEGSNEAMIRLAAISSASGMRLHKDRAIYYLLTAGQYRIDDKHRFVLVQILANLGYNSEALAVAEFAFDNPGSAHYQSEALGSWIRYLNGQIEKDEAVGRIIVTAATR